MLIRKIEEFNKLSGKNGEMPCRGYTLRMASSLLSPGKCMPSTEKQRYRRGGPCQWMCHLESSECQPVQSYF